MTTHIAALLCCTIVLAWCLPCEAQDPAKTGAVSDLSHPGLIEEATFLDITSATPPYRLEAIIVRSAAHQGRLPVALLTHGKPRLPADMALIRPALLARQARDLAYRGYLAVGIVRRGYGQSGGTPGSATNAPYAKCNVADLQRYFEVEADDLQLAIDVISRRVDADGRRIIVIGGSVGGGAALALASRKATGVLAAVNIAGGVRLTNAQGEVICPYAAPIEALGRLGAGTGIPTLWIYSENDSVFGPEIARKAHAAYNAAGGNAELRAVPSIAPDGHHAFELPNGRVYWLAALDAFLRSRGLPTWTKSHVDDLMRARNIPASNREVVEKYFSLYTPKVLLQGPDRRVTYTADTRSLANARETGLAQCLKWAKAECRPIMENFSLVAR